MVFFDEGFFNSLDKGKLLLAGLSLVTIFTVGKHTVCTSCGLTNAEMATLNQPNITQVMVVSSTASLAKDYTDYDLWAVAPDLKNK